ncbi:MAG: PTS cellobiose transporter subunit IIB [Lactobacillaceae bacterium]|jgi:PTS system cellobiose-specific IIB component|nr:PTS cellobiose transporter subunit IIB [Lactobacillaceae bacterium]
MAEILLVDAAGMSISMLSTRMDKYAKDNGLDYDVLGMADAETDEHIKHTTPALIMIAPQVKYMYAKYAEKYGATIPVVNINMMDYGIMNAKNVMQAALDAIEAGI